MLVSLTFRLAQSCTSCMTSIPINGITPAVTCYRCGEVYRLDASWWKNVIGHQEIADAAGLAEGQEMTRIGLESPRYELGFGRRIPQCPNCKRAALDIAALEPGVGSIVCPQCQHAIRTRVPDELCAAIDPRVRFLIGESAASPHEQQIQARTTPVLFACMGCGGGLSVDGSTRAVTCTFCEQSNYLPDGLWQQLNPVPKSHAFYLVCEVEAAVKRDPFSVFDDPPDGAASSSTIAPDELLRLAGDKNRKVRLAVAENPRTPPEALARLSHDEDSGIVYAVASHRSTPFEVARGFASGRDERLILAILANPNLEEEIVEIVATGSNTRCRLRAMLHPNLSVATLHVLAADSDIDIATAAKDRLVELRAEGVPVDKGRGLFKRLFGD